MRRLISTWRADDAMLQTTATRSRDSSSSTRLEAALDPALVL